MCFRQCIIYDIEIESLTANKRPYKIIFLCKYKKRLITNNKYIYFKGLSYISEYVELLVECRFEISALDTNKRPDFGKNNILYGIKTVNFVFVTKFNLNTFYFKKYH